MPGTIVVGVDGSGASVEALRWAVQEARLRDARLVAVHAWTFVTPAPIGDPGMMPMPAADFPGQLEAENDLARSTLAEAVAAALGPELSVEVEKRLVEGDAGDVLVAESGGADLVVVGSHGRSGLKAALVGSVSRHVVAHAACPVVVVKSREQD